MPDGLPRAQGWDEMPDVGKESPLPQIGDKRIGIAKGKFEVPDSIDTKNEDIAKKFARRKS